MTAKRRARSSVQPRPARWAGLWALAKRLMGARATRAGRAVVAVQPWELHALGKDLERVALGEPATVVFKQDLGTWRTNRSSGHDTNNYSRLVQQCAVLYWRNRVAGQNRAPAVGAAIQTVFANQQQKPAAKSILKFAGTHKDKILDGIAGKSVVRRQDGTVEVSYQSGTDVSSVRNSIRKKSRRGKQA